MTWFAYVERRRLRVHRSWTGYAIWELSFTLTAAGFHAERLRVVDDVSVYDRGGDGYEALMADWFVWQHFGSLPEDAERARNLWDQASRARDDA